jgi:hypothetical protein
MPFTAIRTPRGAASHAIVTITPADILYVTNKKIKVRPPSCRSLKWAILVRSAVTCWPAPRQSEFSLDDFIIANHRWSRTTSLAGGSTMRRFQWPPSSCSDWPRKGRQAGLSQSICARYVWLQGADCCGDGTAPFYCEMLFEGMRFHARCFASRTIRSSRSKTWSLWSGTSTSGTWSTFWANSSAQRAPTSLHTYAVWLSFKLAFAASHLRGYVSMMCTMCPVGGHGKTPACLAGS